MHNIKNAASCAAVAFLIGINDKTIKEGLKNFKGVQRRFNFLFKKMMHYFLMTMLTIQQKYLLYSRE